MLNSINREIIGDAIRKARKNKRISQFELAEMAGVDEKQIYRIESGLSSPKLENFIKIALILDLNIKFLKGVDIEKKPYIKEIIDILNNSDDYKMKIYYNVLKSLSENI